MAATSDVASNTARTLRPAAVDHPTEVADWSGEAAVQEQPEPQQSGHHEPAEDQVAAQIATGRSKGLGWGEAEAASRGADRPRVGPHDRPVIRPRRGTG
jgi:hypothetical protein